MRLVVILLGASCYADGAKVGRLQTGSRTVELGGATVVRVEVEMGAGELDVSGGAGELLEADFAYNVAGSASGWQCGSSGDTGDSNLLRGKRCRHLVEPADVLTSKRSRSLES
jgi:hypothetical protein